MQKLRVRFKSTFYQRSSRTSLPASSGLVLKRPCLMLCAASLPARVIFFPLVYAPKPEQESCLHVGWFRLPVSQAVPGYQCLPKATWAPTGSSLPTVMKRLRAWAPDFADHCA